MSTKTEQTFAEWMEANPLRQWRKDNGVSILATAARIKSSMTSVQMWERGVHVPGPEHMANIVAVTGDKRLPSKWEAWKDQQPVG